jgi:hypothetical protein
MVDAHGPWDEHFPRRNHDVGREGAVHTEETRLINNVHKGTPHPGQDDGQRQRHLLQGAHRCRWD